MHRCQGLNLRYYGDEGVKGTIQSKVEMFYRQAFSEHKLKVWSLIYRDLEILGRYKITQTRIITRITITELQISFGNIQYTSKYISYVTPHSARGFRLPR